MVPPPTFVRPGTSRVRRRPSGFTLIELMIVLAILVTLVTIGLTKYGVALENARMVKARETLRTIAFEVDSYEIRNGDYPLTLDEVGMGDRMDPWGNPYIYLNFTTGTGSAVQFATGAGLVDPASFRNASAPSKRAGNLDPDPDAVADLRRTDQFLFPLNSDYDLFCLGPNGKSMSGLNDEFSFDDVIRANDGGYFGPASNY